MDWLIIGVVGYLFGSIPTAVWVGKRFYGVDVREHGSKNAGATNTFRVLGKKPGKIVLLIDVLKGLLAVLTPQFMYPGLGYESIVQLKIIAAVTVILGHVFPLFAGFKGGKGVATALGVIIAIHPLTACICLAIFLGVFLVFNYVSLGAIVTSVFFPIILVFIFNEKSIPLIVFSIVIGSAVIITHKKNIARLMNGTENKMYLRKKIE
jgi:glycerol-3-phosphate acyltransferase PlsY